jgi:ABC-type multidrug transport system fused ATPase/permease subunit
MLKLYNQQKGQILFGGREISDFQTSSILQRVGYVGQDSLLFDETISDNINVGLKTEVTDEQLKQLIKKANAHDVYDINDQSSLTRTLGLKGCHVSGGQRQRLAIARALARNNLKPSILILDEATASLDGKNEEQIQKVINEILQEKNCTIIVVAHRLSTIKNADVINVLANGRVEEKGTHEELTQMNNGIYKSMLNA